MLLFSKNILFHEDDAALWIQQYTREYFLRCIMEYCKISRKMKTTLLKLYHVTFSGTLLVYFKWISLKSIPSSWRVFPSLSGVSPCWLHTSWTWLFLLLYGSVSSWIARLKVFVVSDKRNKTKMLKQERFWFVRLNVSMLTSYLKVTSHLKYSLRQFHCIAVSHLPSLLTFIEAHSCYHFFQMLCVIMLGTHGSGAVSNFHVIPFTYRCPYPPIKNEQMILTTPIIGFIGW